MIYVGLTPSSGNVDHESPATFAYPAYEPDRVLLMAEQSSQRGRMPVAYPTFRDWVEQLESFESLSGVAEILSPTLTVCC